MEAVVLLIYNGKIIKENFNLIDEEELRFLRF